MRVNGRQRLLTALFVLACEPIHDLDAVSAGGEATQSTSGASSSSSQPTTSVAPASDTTSTGAQGSSEPVADSSTTPSTSTAAMGVGTDVVGAGGSGPMAEPSQPPLGSSGAGGTGGETSSVPGAGNGGAPVGDLDAGPGRNGDVGADAGAGGDPGAPTDPLPMGDAPELPIDLPGNPVEGTFTVSSEAEWEVEGVFLPTFEIHTPSASYWLVKDLGMIVSIVDADAEDDRQWIDFSSGFRPLRGLPSFGTFGDTGTMLTTLDVDSQTPTHLRLHSVSESGEWQLVYDFYPTHVTLTVNAAPVPYGIAYRGVPGGALESTDQFVRADGTAQGALISFVADLPGPVEWAYLTDPTLGRSLFMIHHADDSLDDRYQVRDNDSATLSFGDGELSRLPARFSFGLIESSNHQTVAARAMFVIDAIE